MDIEERPMMLFHDEGGGVMDVMENPHAASTITLNTGKSHAEILVFAAERSGGEWTGE